MRLELPGRSTQALLVAVIVLAMLLVIQMLYPAAPNMNEAGAHDDDDASLPEFGSDALAPPELAALGDILDRPLFFDDRRMPEPPKDETPPPPPKPLMLKLQGVALAGGARVAVLRNTSNNLLLQLAEGDSHEGWTLDSVGSASATFSRDEQTAELTLDPGTGGVRR